MSEQQKDDISEEEVMKQYLEQTQIEVQQELAIMRLEKELARLRSAISETRLTKSNLMHKLKGLPEIPAETEVAKALREFIERQGSPQIHPYFDFARK